MLTAVQPEESHAESPGISALVYSSPWCLAQQRISSKITIKQGQYLLIKQKDKTHMNRVKQKEQRNAHVKGSVVAKHII